LDLKFHSFPRAKKNVSEELGRTSTKSIVYLRPVLGEVFTKSLLVAKLEDIIETKLAESLELISHESRSPSTKKTRRTFILCQDAHVAKHTLIKLSRVVLLVAFHHINGGHGGMGKTA